MVLGIGRAILLFLLLNFLGAFSAFSYVETVKTVQEPIKVYSRPTKKSPVIFILRQGDEFEVLSSDNRYYYKVKIKVNKRQRTGFVQKSAERKWLNTSQGKTYMRGFGLRLSANYSHIQQSAFSDTVNDVEYEFGSFQSSQIAPELHLDIPINDHWLVSLSLIQRQTYFTAPARKNIVAAPVVEAVRRQSLVGGMALAKYYFYSLGRLWLGGGMEFSQGTSVEFSFGDQSLQTSEEDLPLFVILKIAVGWDYHLMGNFYFNPELRLGMDLNSDPLAGVIEGVLGFGYRFN